MAALRLTSIPRGPTFQPTDVLHEAFVRIFESEARPGSSHQSVSSPREAPPFDEARAVATLAAAIRSVLVDRVRRRAVRTRHLPHIARDEQSRARSGARDDGLGLLALDEALTRLATIDPRAARVVELRYFAGLAAEHTAALMGQALSTTERDWRFARAWLAEHLMPPDTAQTPESQEKPSFHDGT